MSGVSESPFDRTLFADRNSRMRLLHAISWASRSRDLRYGGHRSSEGEANALKVATLREADQGFYNAARLALLREREACASIAARFDKNAADAILTRPLPEPWSAA